MLSLSGSQRACSTFVCMNRRRIIFIILLVSLSLITLLAVQLYWIRGAMMVERDQFQHRVNEAALNIAKKINKLKIAYSLNLQQRSNEILSSIDSLRSAYYRSHYGDSVPEPSYTFSREYRHTEVLKNDHWETVNSYDTSRILRNQGNLKETDTSDGQVAAAYEHFNMLAGELFEEMMELSNPSQNANIYEQRFLDSLIGTELSNKGLRTVYEFGIFNLHEKRFITEKTGNFTEPMYNEGFSCSLAPNNLFGEMDYLFLYFPNQTRFMLTQLAGMLGVSVLILLILSGSFYYAIRTIILQKKLSVMKTDFINNMTHEFKTPISTVALACEALNDSDIQKSEALYRNYISIISEENRRLGVMAEKILQTAILEKGELKLKPEWFDLHEVILDVTKIMSIQVEIRDGQITTDLHAKQSRIFADKVHITNIITNLLDNANKYTQVKPRIIVGTSNIENGIVFYVSDNGAGISRDNQKKIFEKLFRVPTGNVHNVKGYGLGLSYVKFIVEKHKGSIMVDSDLGQGTKFRIFLPFELNQ